MRVPRNASLRRFSPLNLASLHWLSRPKTIVGITENRTHSQRPVGVEGFV